LVRARSQEVLEVVFAGVLCYTCEVQCPTGLTGGALSAQVFGGERV
jgi:heterodisulfide reductase subunit C